MKASTAERAGSPRRAASAPSAGAPCPCRAGSASTPRAAAAAATTVPSVPSCPWPPWWAPPSQLVAMRASVLPWSLEARHAGPFAASRACCCAFRAAIATTRAVSTWSAGHAPPTTAPEHVPTTAPEHVPAAAPPERRCGNASASSWWAARAKGACSHTAWRAAVVPSSRSDAAMGAPRRVPSKPSWRAASRPPECANPPVGNGECAMSVR